MDYSGNGRSNYVHFTDKEKVKAIVGIYGLRLESNEKGDWIYLGYDNEEGDLKSSVYVSMPEEQFQELTDLGLMDATMNEFESSDDYELPDFFEVISKYLPEGEIFIWQSVGHEGLRYLNGYSYAVNSKGQTAVVNINDIFERLSDVEGVATGVEY